MTWRTTLVLTVGIAVVLFWLLAGCRVAVQRSEISKDKIAFIRHSDIYVMNSDGTGRSNLTSTKMS
jgi:hypothetical protein